MKAIMKACLGKAEFSMETGQVKLEATDLETNSEEIEFESEQQEVHEEKAAAEMITELEDRSGDRSRGRLTGRAVSARRKSRNHKGQTVEKRQRNCPECNNGITKGGLR
jgi:hypothetical protein